VGWLDDQSSPLGNYAGITIDGTEYTAEQILAMYAAWQRELAEASHE
jgi:hypothetical protein